MKVNTFDYKFGSMRKPDKFIVYPNMYGENYLVQGNRTIAVVNPKTNEGILNYKGSNYKTSIHIAKYLGGEEFIFPQEFVDLVIANHPKNGDQIGAGVYVA